MPRRLVLRLGRRRSAWEKTEAREIADVEFRDSHRDGLDLRPSVYVLDIDPNGEKSIVVRTRAEHSASFMSPPRPNAGSLEFNVEGATAAEVVSSAGETLFRFTQDAHAEIQFSSEEDVVRLVETMLQQRAQRSYPVSPSEVLSYVETQLNANDPEWVEVAGTESGAWADAVRAFRRKRETGQ